MGVMEIDLDSCSRSFSLYRLSPPLYSLLGSLSMVYATVCFVAIPAFSQSICSVFLGKYPLHPVRANLCQGHSSPCASRRRSDTTRWPKRYNMRGKGLITG